MRREGCPYCGWVKPQGKLSVARAANRHGFEVIDTTGREWFVSAGLVRSEQSIGVFHGSEEDIALMLVRFGHVFPNPRAGAGSAGGVQKVTEAAACEV